MHHAFVISVELTIWQQLVAIAEGEDDDAEFARKIRPAGSTTIELLVEDSDEDSNEEPNTDKKSKHDPDASFRHTNARYPGVIIEVAYSQKRKELAKLAEDYLLDSNANVQVVVGLDIEYGKKKSRVAAISTWRTQTFNTDNEGEMRVVQTMVDEVHPLSQPNTLILLHLLTISLDLPRRPRQPDNPPRPAPPAP